MEVEKEALECNLSRVVALLMENYGECYKCGEATPEDVSMRCPYIHGDIFDKGKLVEVTDEDYREIAKRTGSMGWERFTETRINAS